MIYLSNINLNKNELQNAIIQPLAAPPSNPKLGQIYTDSTDSKIKWYDGSAWKTIGVVVEQSATNGKIKVDGVEMTVYELPIASATVLGGIKLGAGLIATAAGVVSVDVVNNLTSDDETKPLSAAMGRSLKQSIDSITGDIGELGGGDMMKATYDSDNDGVVEDSDKLGGQLPEYYAKATDIPTNLSDLTNDENFIDNTVANLVNYYSKSEVNTLIGNIATIQVSVVKSLPSTGSSNIIYLVAKTTADGAQNVYDEYLWTGTAFERIGDTTIDLTNYLTKTGDGSDVTVAFTAASSRANIATGEKLSVLLGKIAKYLGDLKDVAFSGSYTDLTNQPTLAKRTTFTLSATSASTTIDGTNVLSVTAIDSITFEAVVCDIKINGKTVTVTATAAPTNPITVIVAYL